MVKVSKIIDFFGTRAAILAGLWPGLCSAGNLLPEWTKLMPSPAPTCEARGRIKSDPPLKEEKLNRAPELSLPFFEAKLPEAEVVAKGILFQWKAVAGTTGYRVQIYREGKLVVNETTSAVRLLLRQLEAGSYLWRVSGQFEEKGTTHWSCEGKASWWRDLTVLPASDPDGMKALEQSSFSGNTHLSFSSRLVSYLYRSSSSLSPGGSSTPALAGAALLAGEYRLSSRFAVGATLENTFYKIQGRGANGTGAEVRARAKIPLPHKPGWMLVPGFGLRAYRYFQFTRPCTGCPPPYSEAIAFGPSVSNELSKLVTPSSRLVFSLDLFYPLALLSAPDGSTLSGFNLNVSASFYGTLLLSPQWELRYGVGYDHRGIQFERAGSGESAQLDSLSGFFAVALRFGR